MKKMNHYALPCFGRLGYILLILLLPCLAKGQADTSRNKSIVLQKVRVIPKDNEDSKKKQYYVALNMTNAGRAAKVHVLIGKEKYGSELSHIVGKFKHNGKNTSIELDGKEEAPCGETIGMLVNIPNGFFKDLRSVTVYIEDEKGNFSNRVELDAF